jgi:SMC interacting uncharacterized protein involved in chromosome segregation
MYDQAMKWIADEKKKTEEWCQEQRTSAKKERMTAAKQARDSRQLGQTSIRKEKQEIEALQASLEKMKIDFENERKKLKANEKRLQSIVKDLNMKLQQYESMVDENEKQKELIWNFLEQLGLKLPPQLSRLRPKNHSSGRDDHLKKSLLISGRLPLLS